MINDWFCIGELLHRDVIFARGQIVLPFIFINSPQANVRFGLKSMAFSNRAIESTDRFVDLCAFAINSSFNGGRFRIDGAITPRSFDFSQGAILVAQIHQHPSQAYVRRGIVAAHGAVQLGVSDPLL